jgi:hypothetical protein
MALSRLEGIASKQDPREETLGEVVRLSTGYARKSQLVEHEHLADDAPTCARSRAAPERSTPSCASIVTTIGTSSS